MTSHVMSNLDLTGNPVFRPSGGELSLAHRPYHPGATRYDATRSTAPAGGDTGCPALALAYDALLPETRRRIAGLRVVFSPAFDTTRPAVDHPLVRTHPDTGAKSLYLGNHSSHIPGLPKTEGAALLAELLDHATQRQFGYVHRWRRGDLVMWDNRCLLHRAVANYEVEKYRRVMHRSVVRGTVPF